MSGVGGVLARSHTGLPASPRKAGLRARCAGRGAVGGKRGSPHEGGTRRLPELGMCLGRGPVLLGGVGHGMGHRGPGAVASSPVRCDSGSGPAGHRDHSSAAPRLGRGWLRPTGSAHFLPVSKRARGPRGLLGRLPTTPSSPAPQFPQSLKSCAPWRLSGGSGIPQKQPADAEMEKEQ